MIGDTSDRKSRNRALVLVFVLALVIRAAAVAGLFGSLEADPDGYRKLAENVRLRGVYTTTDSPTAFRPPLYPLLLTMAVAKGQVSSFAVAAFHVLCGAATVWLTFLLAEACGLRRGAFLAAGLVAIDPILLNQSAIVMTETLATLLSAAGMLALARVARKPTAANAAVAGVVFGLAALCRPTFLPWLGISGLLLLGRGYLPSNVGSLRSNTAVAAIFFLAAALVIAPWPIRNQLVLGKAKVTTTHGGYTVLLGNNPSFYQYLRERKPGQTWDSTPLDEIWNQRQASTSPQDEMWDQISNHAHDDAAHGTRLTEPSDERDPRIIRSELEDDAFAYSLARRYIADEPQMFAYACWVRIGRLWQLIPYPRGDSETMGGKTLRMLAGCWYAILFLLAACGAVFRRRELLRSPLVWGVVLCFTFTAVHAVYWSNMRMRAPLMPLVCLLASLGAVVLCERLCRCRS